MVAILKEKDEFICAVDDFWKDQDVTLYLDGIVMLEHRCIKYIDVNGDYTEK